MVIPGKAHLIDVFHLGGWWYGHVQRLERDHNSKPIGVRIIVFSPGAYSDN